MPKKIKETGEFYKFFEINDTVVFGGFPDRKIRNPLNG